MTADLLRAGCRLLAAARPLADPLSWQRHLQVALRSALERLPLDGELTALAVRHCPVPWRQKLRWDDATLLPGRVGGGDTSCPA